MKSTQASIPKRAEIPFDDRVAILLGSKPEPEELHEPKASESPPINPST